MVQYSLDDATLARLLLEAKQAHMTFEQETGQPDEDWPAWYARYILTRLEHTEAQGRSDAEEAATRS